MHLVNTDKNNINLKKKKKRKWWKLNIPVCLVCWFVWFNINIWNTKERGIWWVEQMTQSPTHEILSGKPVSLSGFVPCLCWFASSFAHFCCMSNVCLCMLVLVSCMCMRWVSVVLTCLYYVCVCVFQACLTFSYFKLTLPGVGGWRCCGQTGVICRSDPLSQLYDTMAELTGLSYPRPYLVFGFPPSLFFLHTWHYMISVPLHSVR